MRNRKIIGAFLSALFLSIFSLFSNTSYFFDEFTVQNGLSNNSVKTIYQDQSGCIWVGTKDGLNRFDGLNFKMFHADIENGIPASSNDITCIKGVGTKLWIGTFNGVYLFDLETYKFQSLKDIYRNQPLPESVVTGIYFEKDYKIWISTKKGLFVLNSKTFKSKLLFKGMTINSLGEADAKKIIVGIAEKGVAVINKKSMTLRFVFKNEKERVIIKDIFKDSKNRVWLGSHAGKIFRYFPEKELLEQIPLAFKSKTLFQNEDIHSIAQINDSTLFIGTNGGIYVINPNNYQVKAHLRANSDLGSINHDRIMNIYKDQQGGVWVGTFSHGLNYYNPYRNQYNFYPLKGKGIQFILGQIIENNGALWFGNEKGLNSFHFATKQINFIDIHSTLSASGFGKESKVLFNEGVNRIWIYMIDKGLLVFDTKNKKFIKSIGVDQTSLVRSVQIDQKGHYWIAEEQLSIFNPILKNFNSELITNKDARTKFTLTQCLLKDKKGNMWVGTRSDGVFFFPWINNEYNLNRPTVLKGLINKNISILFEDSKGRIWIGTNGSGICRYNLENESITVFNSPNGFKNAIICGIQEDTKTGNIWVATTNGVSSIINNKISNYTNQTGLPLSEVSQGAFMKASDGNFYIGGREGLVSFNPSNFGLNPYKPTVVINSLRSLKEEAVEYSSPNDLKQVELSYSQSSFVISFSATNYLFPKANRFAYKLKSAHKEWIEIGSRNELSFIDLTEGDYQFCIKACNNDGVWNDKFTELHVHVLPPLWRSWWAKLFYIVIFLFIVYLIIQYFNIKNAYTYQLKLDQIEKENNEQNHQMKLRLFTNFSHELRTPLTLIIDPLSDMIKDVNIPEKIKFSLYLAHKNANRLLLLVNHLMDFRKLENNAMKLNVCQIDIHLFISELINTFKDYAEKRQVKLDYSVDYSGTEVWFDPMLMEKLFFNLISNAFKSSKSGDRITLTITQNQSNLLVGIKDSGIGIPEKELLHIFDPFFQVSQGDTAEMFGSGIGLNLAKAIIELHKGEIWAESTINEGAIFFVKFPLGNKHFAESDFTNAKADTWVHKKTEEESLFQIEQIDQVEYNNINTQKSTILIVEDDSDLISYIRHVMMKDYNVIEAENGAEGFKMAVEIIPELIISDVMMPIMSGTELCKKIKSDICTAHIPVLLLTAKTLTNQIQAGYEFGADEYMLKPFDSNLLKTRVANLIKSRDQLKKIFKMNFSLPEINTPQVSLDDKFINKLFDFVERNIDNSELQIEDFSSEIGVSRAQLFRKLKSLTDTTPNKLLLQIRLKTALKLLQTNEYPINEVAYKVGFSDPAYFGKCFKAEYNMTPKTYASKYKG
jgi:signal transduction histidine kinase/ligand-binding sensor domain-containing protein/DNA-binding response OmpR family regulator